MSGSAVDPAELLAARIGLRQPPLDILHQALVHGSYRHEHPDDDGGHNERLEFLGDAVVDLVVSEALYLRHPLDDEGILSARRAAIVSTQGLAALGERLGLGELLRLGEGERQRGGAARPSVLAAAFEAVVGALFLARGYAVTRRWLLRFAGPELGRDSAIGTLKSPKSRLQEHTQQWLRERPDYRLVDLTGPDHERLFVIEVAVAGRVLGRGTGPSRRVAETSAAAQALAALSAGEAAGAGHAHDAHVPAAPGTEVPPSPAGEPPATTATRRRSSRRRVP